MMDLGLAGKRALVTGGSKGIGLATASRLAAEGALVAIAARRPAALQEAAEAILRETPGAKVVQVPVDVSTSEGAATAVHAAVDALGGLEILVNNAGRAAARPFLENSDDAWQEDLDLKLFGAIRTSRLAVPHMRAAGWGRIVNVTAVMGKHPGPSSSPTSVSRAAGLALTKLLSKELAADGILVNAVCIGVVRSEQIARAATARFPGVSLEEAYAQMGKGIPLGRVGRADEAADVIAFLCSERASYVTGVAINIDGGSSAVL
jgi:NAD(P)-dependent dehydrogenase (short-subunit alcohol dehydrogenase family)